MKIEIRMYSGWIEEQYFVPTEMTLRDVKKWVRHIENRIHYPYSYSYVAAVEYIDGQPFDFNFFWKKEKEIRGDMAFLRNRREPGDTRLYREAVMALASLYEQFLAPLDLVDC